MFDKLTKGTISGTKSAKDFTVKKWKRFIRKKALKRVEKLMEYAQDDLVNQRVDISSNRHNLEGLDDTVRYLSKQFLKARQKLDNNENQSYLVSGNLSTIYLLFPLMKSVLLIYLSLKSLIIFSTPYYLI